MGREREMDEEIGRIYAAACGKTCWTARLITSTSTSSCNITAQTGHGPSSSTSKNSIRSPTLTSAERKSPALCSITSKSEVNMYVSFAECRRLSVTCPKGHRLSRTVPLDIFLGLILFGQFSRTLPPSISATHGHFLSPRVYTI